MTGQTRSLQGSKKISRPKSVKVLNVTYEIQYLDEDRWYAVRAPGDAVGLTERDKALIILRADPLTDEDQLRATLLHEVLHTCTQATRFDRFAKDVDDVEELFVAHVSPLLLMVMHDNPNVLAYLLSSGASA